jgi:hypothetical protein
MPFKLTQTELTRYNELVEALELANTTIPEQLEKAAAAIKSAMAAHLDEIWEAASSKDERQQKAAAARRSALAPLNQAINDCNVALATIMDFRATVARRMWNSYNEKPDNWKESEDGLTARTLIEKFEAVSLPRKPLIHL